MKKYSLIIIIVLLVCAGIGAYIYQQDRAKQLEGKEFAVTTDTFLARDSTSKIDCEYAGYVLPQFTYRSKDNSIASVDQDGVITAHKEGKTIIYVTIQSKGKRDKQQRQIRLGIFTPVQEQLAEKGTVEIF